MCSISARPTRKGTFTSLGYMNDAREIVETGRDDLDQSSETNEGVHAAVGTQSMPTKTMVRSTA